MSKTIIEVKCFDQVLTLTNTPVIASGGAGEDFVSAEFCEKWNGFAVSMLFWRQGMDPIPVLADENGLYPVPPALTTADGVVYFGAVGVDQNGVRRTSEGTSYRIKAGAITENTTLPEPDGDVFTQLLAQYADVKLYVAARFDGAVDAAQVSQEAAVRAEAFAAAASEAASQAAWRTVVFIPYDGAVHTLSEAQVGEVLPLPERMDMTAYNYEYEIIALGIAVTGATAYNVNLPSIELCKDTYKNRIHLSLENTEEMEDGVIPPCSPFGYYLNQGFISINQRKFWKSGEYWEVGSERNGFAVVRGYSDISEAYEYYNCIRLSSYAAGTTTTYGLMFRYRAIPKE